jgi:hypothetical protein
MHKSFYTFFILIFVFLVSQVPAFAEDSVFTIQNVKVDVTAKNAVSAREQAFRQAQTTAFNQLIERLLSKDEIDRFIKPETSIISSLVKDYEITEEQLSAVRYIGTYTFRFKNKEIKNLLASQGTLYTDVGSKPVLVLPFYQKGAEAILWGESNPFLSAWKRVNTYQGLVPIIVPIGDLEDVSDIETFSPIEYNPDNISNIVERYRAREAIIILATPQWTSNVNSDYSTPSYINILMYQTTSTMPLYYKSLRVQAREDDNLETLFDLVVRDVQKTLQEEWKSKTIIDPSQNTQNNTIKFRVRFNTMKEWIDTQAALKKVRAIEKTTLLSLTPNQASLEILFEGSPQRLQIALSQADLSIKAPTNQFASPYMEAYSYNSNFSVPIIYDLFLNKYKRTY